jgi:hypothetical protein
MGYSVYITRRQNWYDAAGSTISLEEWQALIDADPEFLWSPELGGNFAVWGVGGRDNQQWICWDAGNLESKHPDDAMVQKLCSLASSLGATVQGEGGEIYRSGATSQVHMPVPFAERARAIWLNLLARFRPPSAESPGFEVGARVRDYRGRVGTVTRLDLRAESGLGVILVQYDDGCLEASSAIAHSLEPLGREAGGIG